MGNKDREEIERSEVGAIPIGNQLRTKCLKMRRRRSRSSKATRNDASNDEMAKKSVPLKGQPDDIFDMTERYQCAEDNNATTEFRDDATMISRGDKRAKRQNSENLVIEIMETTQIREVLDGLQQAQPVNDKLVDGESSIEKRYRRRIEELTARLEREEHCSRVLARKLEEAEKQHLDGMAESEQRLSDLQAKMTLQEKSFKTSLGIEKAKSSSLAEALNDSTTDNRVPTEEMELLQVRVKELEEEASNLRAQKVVMEISLESSQDRFDSANKRIDELGKKLVKTTEELKLEKVASRKNDLEVAKTEEKRDSRAHQALILSEAKTKLLLAAERKKSETLTKLNDRMKIAMKKLSRKVAQGNSHDQVTALAKEVERKDEMISSIVNNLRKETSPSTFEFNHSGFSPVKSLAKQRNTSSQRYANFMAELDNMTRASSDVSTSSTDTSSGFMLE